MSLGSAFSLLLPPSCRRLGPLCSALFAVTLAALPLPLARAQNPGDLDPNFSTSLSNSSIFTLQMLVDPSTPDPVTGAPLTTLVAGGDFFTFARVFPNSGIAYTPPQTDPNVPAISADAGFGSAGRIVYTLAPDKYAADPSRFFAGGQFGKRTSQPYPSRNIFRLTTDFRVDPTFNTGEGANNYVTAILPTADGKVVVGGLFDKFNNQSRKRIVRLNDYGVADGSIDLTFNPALSIDQDVLTLAEQLDPASGQPNGQILVGGLFNKINNIGVTKLARLNNDGSLDLGFRPVIDLRVTTVVAQPDGKILIGGDFTMVNGVAALHIARLNVDGTLDTTFQAVVTQGPPGNVNPVAVYTIVLLPDGRMYVGGNFVVVNGYPRQFIVLLNMDGSVDTSFDPKANVVDAVQTILPMPNGGDVYIGQTLGRGSNGTFPLSLVALYGLPGPPAPGSGTTVPLPDPPSPPVNPATVSIVRHGRVAGGPNMSVPTDGMFVLTRDTADASGELTVQLMVGGTVRQHDMRIQGFPGVTVGTPISYTFAPGQTTRRVRIRHRDIAKPGDNNLILTVMGPEDGASAYVSGDADVAILPVHNE